MRDRSRFGLCDLFSNGFTKTHQYCTWACLALSSLVYFSSLIAIVYYNAFEYSKKWSFILYVATSAILYLLCIMPSVLIISAMGVALPYRDRRVPIRSSIIRNRVQSLNPQLPRLITAQDICHQEVQTNEIRITPPPPYEDLSDGRSEEIQLPANEGQHPESDSLDIMKLLNLILLAINNSRAKGSEQPSQMEQGLKYNCKTADPKSGTSVGSQRNGTEQATSESSKNPQLQPDVLEHISDPNMFIRTLAKYQSLENRKAQYMGSIKRNQVEKGKNIEEQDVFHRRNGQKLEEENLENLSLCTNGPIKEPVKSMSQNLKNPSPRRIVKQELKVKTGLLSERGSCDSFSIVSQKLGSSSPIRNSDEGLALNVKSKGPTRAQSYFGLESKIPQGSISPQRKNVSRQDHSSLSPRVSEQDVTFISRKDFCQQHRSSQSSGISQYPYATKQMKSSVEDLSSRSSRDSQRDHTRQYSRVSLKDLSSRDYRQDLASKYSRGSKQDLSSRDCRQDLASKCPRGSKQDISSSSRNFQRDLSLECPNASEQDSSATSRDSHLDFSSRNPLILQDIGSANLIGIPLIDYPKDKPEEISNCGKYISFKQLLQAQGNSNEALKKTQSIQALSQHRYTPDRTGPQSKTDSASDSNLLEVKTAKFSTESVASENMKPEEWFASWIRGLNKMSHKHDSTLFGARL